MCTGRTVLIAVRALTDGEAASRVGETGESLWTFAHIAGWCDLADGRWRAIVAGGGGFAAEIWNRITAETGRALAYSVLVFCNANGIFAARLLVANVVTRVR